MASSLLESVSPALAALLSNVHPAVLAAVVFIGLPVVAIALNVAQQFLPKDPNLPPVVFHWLPYVGSAISYGDDPLKFFFTNREKYGDVFTFVLLGRRMTAALGPKGNNFILGGKLTHVSAEEAYTHLTTPVFGKEVVYDVPNPVFMEQKRFVKCGLTIENFREYVGFIEDEVEEMLAKNESFVTYRSGDTTRWGSFHALRTLAELTICTASRTLQGREVRASLSGREFAEMYSDLDGGFTPINLMFPSLPLPSYRRRDRAQQAMSDFYVNILNKREAGDNDHDHDMLAALAEQRYKNGRKLSKREIAHIMIALLMAGQHTSSATSSWALLHLASRPDVVQAVYDEQVKHFSNGDGSFRALTYEELRELPILDSVIRETLRMHPPIHSILRKVVQDMPVPASLSSGSSNTAQSRAYVVPQGHFVLASPAVSQMDPRIWKDASVWDPYRWSDPEGVAAEAALAYEDLSGEKIDYGFGVVSKGTESPYQPFGAGRHRCIGEQFAYLQLGTILALLIRNMEFKIDRVPDHNYHTMITLPKEPCSIQYRRRAKAT
ncbi:hypothetical protein BOTBODRAFT_27902 [Botryobasidium botryosum FD-172 SS1]|uniref:Lanosterol 14-alpha-demethylase n=1 Tax=Botryobasidium botryosum (strain FD-172 SS1) TaxID=930990 RepID=A0A067MUD3_BOTB1|nr:hypothetical protein BOTBODRAFT_27902 [Botryobasidium botryosum FD-172 SS1]